MTPPRPVRPFVLRVMLNQRRVIWSRFVSRKAAEAEAAKLHELGWITSIDEE